MNYWKKKKVSLMSDGKDEDGEEDNFGIRFDKHDEIDGFFLYLMLLTVTKE